MNEREPTCDTVRESLSALMDREWPTLGRDQVTTHLADCRECSRWRDRALQATRRATAQTTQPPPGLTESLIAALGGRRWSRWTMPVRVGLAVVGWAIAALAMPALVYGIDAEAPPHVAHEMGSLNVALGLALILTAIRPRHVIGVLPLSGVVVLFLTLTAGDDILTGQVTWRSETPHMLMVAGFVLLFALNRLQRPVAGPDDPRTRDRLPLPTLGDRRRSDADHLAGGHRDQPRRQAG